MRLVRRSWVLGAALAAAMAAGCKTDEYAQIETGSIGEPLGVLGGSPSAEDVAQGRKFFGAGSYGLAEQHFRRAVEANPNSVSAWVGLAASYDQLKRFDLAEKAYQRALSLHGRQPLLLNNYGYHYLLRGKKGAARKILREAERKAPDDPAIQHNLALLENWSYADQFDGVPEKPRKFDLRVKRHPELPPLRHEKLPPPSG